MITIERKTQNGYETKEYSNIDALNILNNDISNGMIVWINSNPISEIITEENLININSNICVTNKLIGG